MMMNRHAVLQESYVQKIYLRLNYSTFRNYVYLLMHAHLLLSLALMTYNQVH